jgi:peptidoglycan/xylan/chitin deacetylase (PgdA/CDA1 family)
VGRAIVLAFDDGFANFYTEVFPLLRQFGMTATVFLVTDFVGDGPSGMRGPGRRRGLSPRSRRR